MSRSPDRRGSAGRAPTAAGSKTAGNPRAARRSEAAGREAGVVAIIVALSVSTFLLGFAALAVDLGSAYTRKAELQSIADQLALAGAAGLPDIQHPGGALDLIRQSLTQLCRTSPTPGICPADGAEPDLTWATDGRADNGEITFYTDPDGDGQYHPADQVRDLATPSTALQVTLPPSTVQFGLASAFGYDSAVLHRTATARIGTPLGSGLLPFALTPADLRAGQFCVRAGDDDAVPVPTPTGTVTLKIQTVVPGGVVYGKSGVTLDINLTVLSGPKHLDAVRFHLTNSPDPITPVYLSSTPDASLFRVTLPVGDPVPVAKIWATGDQVSYLRHLRIPFVTDTDDIHYTGLPDDDGLCAQPAAERGYLQLARPGMADPAQYLEQNIRSGPAVRMYPAGGALGSLGSLLNCASTQFIAATTCLSGVTGSAFTDSLTNAFLTPSADGTPGRLIGDCGNGVASSHGRSGIDDSRLFTDPGLLAAGHGQGWQLEDRITGKNGVAAISAGPGDQGWVTSTTLRCPRLAVMPVLGPAVAGGIGNRITSFSYVWIDDYTPGALDRGLIGQGSTISAFRGYVIDPGYLPGLVSGSPVVGPYLGGDMPREALLVSGLTTPDP